MLNYHLSATSASSGALKEFHGLNWVAQGIFEAFLSLFAKLGFLEAVCLIAVHFQAIASCFSILPPFAAVFAPISGFCLLIIDSGELDLFFLLHFTALDSVKLFVGRYFAVTNALTFCPQFSTKSKGHR